jgi:hypothetical protein
MNKILRSILILITIFSCNQNHLEKNENTIEIKKNSEYDEIFEFSQNLFDGIKNMSISNDSLKSFDPNIIKKGNKVNDVSVEELTTIYKSLEFNSRSNSNDFNWGNMQYRRSTCENYITPSFLCNSSRQISYDLYDFDKRIQKEKSTKFYLVTVYFTDKLTRCEYYIDFSVIKNKGKIILINCIAPTVIKIKI